ncbi:MAG: replicative DNA helicase [bacterium]
MVNNPFIKTEEVKTNLADLSLPPYSNEAEQSVLGALLIDKEAMIDVADIIRAEDFYKREHSILFSVMIELFENQQPIDIVSMAERLEAKKQLADAGGRSYLASLANVVPTAAHVVHYAKIVEQKAILRGLLKSAGTITELAHHEDEEVSQLIDKAEQSLFSVSTRSLRQRFTPIKEVLTETFERIDELHKDSGKLRGLSTGYNDLDNLLAGLQKSDMVVLAARPSMGKTSFALDMARNVAVNQKIPVGIFSLEMSKEQLVDRLLCSQAGIDLWKMRTGNLATGEGTDDFPAIGEAMGVLSDAPIYIDDTAASNIMEIRTKARRLHMEHKIEFLIIDYLQLIEGYSSKGSENRVQEISQISRTIKAIARELNIPVLALSQLSRAVESRTSQIPQLSDLRESGSIEQDADVVMFIYREVMYKPETDRKNIAEIHIKKHRNGPTGKIDLFFDHNLVSFRNLDKKYESGNKTSPPESQLNKPNV